MAAAQTDDRVLERYGDRCTVVSAADRGQADAVNNGLRATSGRRCRLAEF